MNKWHIGSFIGATTLTLVVGYYLGEHARQATATSAVQPRKILYYRAPMSADTSPIPKKDPMGMDYVPVYADAGASALPPLSKKILYYRNPMGLPDTSATPKKDEMGMDYLPVYEGDDDVAPGQVRIEPERIQKLGVRTEIVTRQTLTHHIRAAGTIQVDEGKQHIVAAKFEGWVDRLRVNTTGQPVRKGEPLMDVYSPDLVSAQREFVIAWQGQKSLHNADSTSLSSVRQLSEAALQRLRYWDISERDIEQLKTTGETRRTLELNSPASGIVLDKPAVAGMRFAAGDPLFKIADLSSVWLIAEVFEQDIRMLRVGQRVDVAVDAYPGDSFKGQISFIYPTLNPETRTAKVRIEMNNARGLLKPSMFANVDLKGWGGASPVIVVPNSAILDSGKRQVVLLQRGEGLFEPREIKLGMRADQYTEIRSGLSGGETVVVSANFLIDAESNLKAALSSFGHGSQGNPSPTASQAATLPEATPDHAGH